MPGAVEPKGFDGKFRAHPPGRTPANAGGHGRSAQRVCGGREPRHLYQIWILPERHGITPGYEQKAFPIEREA